MNTGFARGGTLDMVKTAITVADPSQPDMPLIYANQAFEDMTGHPVDTVLGRNCRFLQGKDTDRAAIDRIKEAIQAEDDIDICLTNYTRTGQRFDNLLMLSHITVRDGRKLILGCQYNITNSVMALDLHVRAVDGVQARIASPYDRHQAQSLSALRMRSQNMRVLIEHYLHDNDLPDLPPHTS